MLGEILQFETNLIRKKTQDIHDYDLPTSNVYLLLSGMSPGIPQKGFRKH